jgi:D-serine deaminase-like pyridoxal phosphate-dependent protein
MPELGTPVDELDTPALLLNLDLFNANLVKMAAFFDGRQASLRPHAKTHKCPQIALRQLEAGAIGITCAKVGEAEVMVEAGVNDILIANQVTGTLKIDRLTDLAKKADLMVAVDDSSNVAQLSSACAAKEVQLRVLVEVDIGMGRCGTSPGAPARDLARQVSQAPGLLLKGLMGYEGHLVLVVDFEERTRRVHEELEKLVETAALLEQTDLPVEIVSGGGTGTFDITGDHPLVTEVQAGSYVFMDSTYRTVRREFESSLTLLSSVVSRPVPERIVLDTGLKTVTKEFGWPTPLDAESVSVRYLSEEHGVLDLAEPEAVPWRAGDRVRLLPSHCCTTVNLHDTLYVIQDDRLVDLWPIAARGRAQ